MEKPDNARHNEAVRVFIAVGQPIKFLRKGRSK